jgi:hypothetical protein
MTRQFASEGSQAMDVRGERFATMMGDERQVWGAIVKQIGLAGKTEQ